MTLNLDPQVESELYALADEEGIAPSELIEKMYREYQMSHKLNMQAKNLEAIRLLQSWRAEDATSDDAELEQRDRETEQLLRNVESNRVSFDTPEL